MMYVICTIINKLVVPDSVSSFRFRILQDDKAGETLNAPDETNELKHCFHISFNPVIIIFHNGKI